MAEPTDTELLGLLGGTLEPHEEVEARARLDGSPDAQARFTLLARELQDALEPPSRAWFVPPPSATPSDRPRLHARPMATLGADQIRVGETFEIRIGPHASPADVDLFVLRRTPGSAWELLFPGAAEERTPLSVLAPDAEGVRTLPVVAAEPPGPQRYAVALVPDGVLLNLGAAPRRPPRPAARRHRPETGARLVRRRRRPARRRLSPCT